jgi:hypothetical protein
LEDPDAVFAAMLAATEESANVLNRVARISEARPNLRAALLMHLKGSRLMSELRRDLRADPGLSLFSPEQRQRILENWIENGDLDLADDFLGRHAADFDDAWWLRALIHKNRAEFELAANLARNSIVSARPIGRSVDPDALARVARQFAVQPEDETKGLALLATYLESGDFDEALGVIDSMLEGADPDPSLFYWKGESLYQINEYVESWFAFEAYLKRLWGRPLGDGD